MKLSEMNFWELSNALLKAARPVEKLCGDEEIWEIVEGYERLKKEKQKSVLGMIRLASKLIPVLVNKHRLETAVLVSIVEGKTLSEISEMKGMELAAEMVKAWREELMPFFTQFVRGE